MQLRHLGSVISAAACLVLFGGELRAQAEQVVTLIDMPAQPLAEAIQSIARQTNTNILVDPRLIAGHEAPAIKQPLSVGQALTKLLEGTGLTPKYVDEKTITLVSANARVTKMSLNTMGSGPGARDSIGALEGPQPDSGDQNRSFMQRLRLSQATGTAASRDEPASPVSADKLEEIIVTSQKREEKLQDVPVSVQVIGGPALQQQNYNNLDDVLQTVPGVATNDTGAESTTIFIRGIGSGNNNAFDQSVAAFYDDIFHGRSRMSGATFLDLDRIEVLKGPQSTFFGNNAIAGALNIVSKKPGDKFEGWGRMLYGQFGQYAVEGAVGGPVTDTFGVRVAVTRSGESGWIDNVTLDEHIPAVNDEAARLTLEFKPTHDLDATLRIEGSQHRAVGSPFNEPLQAGNCPPPAPFTSGDILFCPQLLALRSSGVQVPAGLDNNLTSSIAGAGNWLSTAESALTVNYDHWGQTFTSVTGFYNYHFNTKYVVPEPESLYNSQVPERYHQFSQELRVASSIGGPIEYLAGAYFQTDQLYFAYDANLAYVGPIGSGQILATHNDDTQGEHTYAVFGSATWNITDSLKLSGGIRGSWDKKDYVANAFTGTSNQLSGFGGGVPQPDFFGPPTLLSGDGTGHDWMPSAKIQYQFTSRGMGYFSFSQGWKAGGFNGLNPTANPADVPYGPEHVNAYELGLKSEWLDDTVLLNLAVFRSSYNDLQVGVVVTSAECPAGCNIVRNAASSVTQGMEVEAQWVLRRDFQLSANVSYVDAYYVSYPNGSPTSLAKLLEQQNEDLSGTRIPGTPRWSGSISATYSTRLPGNYKFITQALPYFSSNYYRDDFGQFQGSYTRLDARLALETPDGRCGVDLIGKNLADRIIALPPIVNLVQAVKQEPRNVAVQVRYKF